MKLTHVLSSTAALVTLLTLGRAASAQDAPPDAAPLPTAASTQPAPSPPPGAVVVVAAPSPPPPRDYAPGGELPPPVDFTRFRFGIEAGGGYTLISSSLGSARGAAIRVGLRLGVQLNNPWAVYLQSSLPLGFIAGETGDGTTLANVAVAWSNGVLAEYTLGNILHLGLGPSWDQAFGALCAIKTDKGNGTTPQPSNTSCIGSAGASFGLTGRIAATFGGARPGRRSGFSVALDLHPTFTSSATYFLSTLNLGYEAY